MAQDSNWGQRMWLVKERRAGGGRWDPQGSGEVRAAPHLWSTSVQGGSITHLSQEFLWAGAAQLGKNRQVFWYYTYGQDRAPNLCFLYQNPLKFVLHQQDTGTCQPHCCFSPSLGQLCTSVSHQEKTIQIFFLLFKWESAITAATKPHYIFPSTPVLRQTHPHHC